MVPFNNIYQGKRVLITGHTGFKGSWLSLWLKELGASVIGYALEPNTTPNLFEDLRLADNIIHVTGDVRDGVKLKRVFKEYKPHIVFHLAAQSLVRLSYKDPVMTYETNLMGTVNVLEAVRETEGIRVVVNVTSDKCYENKEWVYGYRETDSMGGYDPYSSSKACSELVTSAYRSSYFNPADYAAHGVGVASARAGNVIGGGDWAADRLIPDCVRAILKGEKVVIRNPRSIRPWQHVLEPLCGYLGLAQKVYEDGPRYAEAWNFGPDDDDAKPVEWLVKRLCTKMGRAASYEIDKGEHPHEAHYLKLDCSKAKLRLGWRPRWNLEKAIDSIGEWISAYKEKRDVRAVCLEQINEYSKTIDIQKVTS